MITPTKEFNEDCDKLIRKLNLTYNVSRKQFADGLMNFVKIDEDSSWFTEKYSDIPDGDLNDYISEYSEETFFKIHMDKADESKTFYFDEYENYQNFFEDILVEFNSSKFTFKKVGDRKYEIEILSK